MKDIVGICTKCHSEIKTNNCFYDNDDNLFHMECFELIYIKRYSEVKINSKFYVTTNIAEDGIIKYLQNME